MSESIEYSIDCKRCGETNELSGKQCFSDKLYCSHCEEDYENYKLEKFLEEFASDIFDSNIEFHIENKQLWLNTRNAASFLGFHDKSGRPNSKKISDLCRAKHLDAFQLNKGARWKVFGNSLYFYSRKLKKESTGISTREAAIILNIDIHEVRRRIHLNKNDPNWIDGEKRHSNKIGSRYIVYLNR